jgi:hypothetical protein
MKYLHTMVRVTNREQSLDSLEMLRTTSQSER